MMKSNLKNKVWLSLLVFSLFILGIFWLLQILFLNTYYEWNKKSEIKNIADEVKKAYKTNNHSDILDSLAFKKDVCIEIASDKNISYSTDSISRGCLIDNNSRINDYKLKFMQSNNDEITYKIINPRFKNKTLLYGFKIDDDVYAFISTSLEPINSTVSALKKLFLYITIIVLTISFIVAYSISKKISKPIEKLTKASKELANGNYNIKFKAYTDIKEIQELENTLNKVTEELSKTDTLRRELLANVSHDLKTPLTLIKANAEMVKDLTYNKKEKRDNNLNTIIDEVDRLNLLVEDILDLSKIQSNYMQLELENFNLHETIKSIIKKFDVLCEKDNYKIEYTGFDCFISADKKRLEQAIYNLINNSINYTGEDKNVYINLIDLKESIRVEIKDTGKGIDDEEIKYVWDRYYKLDKKYKRVTYGTGLGLSIVKNVFELHNFKYGIQSKKNEGTCFYFEIKKSKKQKM